MVERIKIDIQRIGTDMIVRSEKGHGVLFACPTITTAKERMEISSVLQMMILEAMDLESKAQSRGSIILNREEGNG